MASRPGRCALAARSCGGERLCEADTVPTQGCTGENLWAPEEKPQVIAAAELPIQGYANAIFSDSSRGHCAQPTAPSGLRPIVK